MATTQVFLLLTNNINSPVIKLFNDIKKGAEKFGETYFLFHRKEGSELPAYLNETNSFTFTDDILKRLKYIPLSGTLVPGSNHFPLLDFYKTNPGYDHYWLIEDDVRFSGLWHFLFSTFSEFCNYDLLASYIGNYSEEPNWFWWNSLSHNEYFIPLEERYKSFHPIYRLSNAALAHLFSMLDNKWVGHHEVLIPTLLYRYNYKLLDFGGEGKFVRNGFENKFYIAHDRNTLPSVSTLRYRPTRYQEGNSPNKIYHPVKPLFFDKEQFMAKEKEKASTANREAL
jgi:hypothetical protein